MANIPTLRVRSANFRSKTSSDDQNAMTEETLFDLNNLFNLVNEQEERLADVKEVLSVENKYQSIRIGHLLQELADVRALNQQIQQANGKYSANVYVDKMFVEATVAAQEKANIDTYHSILTLPISDKVQSKVHLYDDIAKEVVIPSTLGVDITPAADDVNIFDNDSMYAFNGENADIWRRKYTFTTDSTVDKVETVVTITLPDNIISNRDINTISIHPFPLSTVDIDKIEYRMDGGWNVIPGWPKDSMDNPVPIQDAGNLKFCFESLPMAEVRITFTQRNFIVENNQKVFYVGAQEIGIAYTDYKSSVGRFTAPLSLPGKLDARLITGVKPKFVNEEALSDKSEEKRGLFNYSIYMVGSNGVIQYTRDTLPIMITSDNIIIRANINADPRTGATPALESIEVEYEDLV